MRATAPACGSFSEIRTPSQEPLFLPGRKNASRPSPRSSSNASSSRDRFARRPLVVDQHRHGGRVPEPSQTPRCAPGIRSPDKPNRQFNHHRDGHSTGIIGKCRVFMYATSSDHPNTLPIPLVAKMYAIIIVVESRKFSPPTTFPLHQRNAMPHKAHTNGTLGKPHPWGAPPWTVDFRPAPRALPDHVDFAIVGAGFSGLSAAAWLGRFAPGRSVLVLESASLGNGASGRTGGMALTETAAGQLPGLGDVLADYKKILSALRIDARLTLPGVWELGRSGPAKASPRSWSDSGELKVVRRVPGGTVDPAKVLAGLARAAENAGAQIVEHAEVRSLDFSNSLRLRVRHKLRGRIEQKEISAGQVLLATNAFSLELT